MSSFGASSVERKAMESADKSRTELKNDRRRQPSYSNSRTKTSLATTNQGGRCYLCQGQHLIYSCKQFLRLSPEDRMREVKQLKLCINCLKNDHFVKNCRSSSCRQCGEKHNTLCHFMEATRGSTAQSKGRSIATGEESSGNFARKKIRRINTRGNDVRENVIRSR